MSKDTLKDIAVAEYNEAMLYLGDKSAILIGQDEAESWNLADMVEECYYQISLIPDDTPKHWDGINRLNRFIEKYEKHTCGMVCNEH